ncbi:DUF3152 domain-containing protein [Salininema proteolyticum]|uniref:DUF3152 domain-containing protein n=1 Tax=Salininema proteolyticum TaxID=1607685 RepID=A0ABV8U099_9ACTN
MTDSAPSRKNGRPGRAGRGLALTAVAAVVLLGAGAVAYNEFNPGEAGAPTTDRTTDSPSESIAPPTASATPGTAAEDDDGEPASRTLRYRGSGSFTYAEGTGEDIGEGGQHLNFNIAVEKGADLDLDEFASEAVNVLSDERSWIAGDWSFTFVGEHDPADFTLYLTSPYQRSVLCGSSEDVSVSCRNGDSVVINSARWLRGVPHWDDDLESYRQYVVNHEIGHRLGMGHNVCGGEGEPSPVMAQQTYQLGGCESNGWPYPDGKTYLDGPPGEYGGPALPPDDYDEE